MYLRHWIQPSDGGYGVVSYAEGRDFLIQMVSRVEGGIGKARCGSELATLLIWAER